MDLKVGDVCEGTVTGITNTALSSPWETESPGLFISPKSPTPT